MCGRFVATLPIDEMARVLDAQCANDVPLTPNYNVCPTTAVHVVVKTSIGRRLGAMRWGFLPSWYKSVNDGPLLINARSESIATKPAFAQACRQRRCLIPSNGFYEWQKDDDGIRHPYFIQRADQQPMIFAGIWQYWGQDHEKIASCAIVTTPANQDVAHIHQRLPLMLAPDQWSLWLGEEGHGAAQLMHPPAQGLLQYHRVSRAVNSNRTNGPELIIEKHD